jgi:glycine/D-amino acid oxidase-like deaminating enzyme
MCAGVNRNLLIVGQGLAGSIAALTSVARGWRVAVIDSYPGAKASRAAAGILNPVTGPRLHLSWNIDTTLPAAEYFYRYWEEQLASRFFERKIIRRIFRTHAEVDYHSQRFADANNRNYLGPLEASPQSKLGECRIQAAVLNIPSFLQAAGKWLRENATVSDGFLAYAELRLQDDAVYWRGQAYQKVLFCEGHHVRDNPWFGHLPFKPAKGQSIAFTCERPLGSDILSADKWLLPQSDCSGLAGSTYEWQDLDEQPTDQGRDLLLRKVAAMLPDNPVQELTEHHAGIRPCSHDRRPYVGCHPRYPSLGILNGLGSKGTLFAPWCAKQWLIHAEKDTVIDPAIDVARCRKAWRQQLNG